MQGGLLGLSGISSDLRDIRQAAAQGNTRAQLAIDAFVESCRHYLGAFAVAMGGIDALTFTGGIGQHEPTIREAICADLDFLGVKLDQASNTAASGKQETAVHADDSRAQVWVLPANEELIVARQTFHVLSEITV